MLENAGVAKVFVYYAKPQLQNNLAKAFISKVSQKVQLCTIELDLF